MDSLSPSLASSIESPLPPLPPSAKLYTNGLLLSPTSEDGRSTVPPKSTLGLGVLGPSHESANGTTLASVEGKINGPELGGASIALQRQVRSLDGIERIGRLLTLDLKGNEIKVSSPRI